MSGAPLFTLVIFMKVNNIYNIVDVSVEFLLDFVLFFNLFTQIVIFMKVDNYFMLMLVFNFAF